MPTTKIYLEPSAIKKRLQVVNDALPGIILLFTGLSALLDRGLSQGIMPYLSVATGVIVVRAAIEELRTKKERGGVNWFDISSGIVILIEVVNTYKPYKGFQPAHLLFLVGVITILRGIFAEKWPRRRRVELSEDGLFARTKPFRSIAFRWSDVERISRSPAVLTFLSGEKTFELNLKRVGNRDEVIEKIIEAATERNIQISQLSA